MRFVRGRGLALSTFALSIAISCGSLQARANCSECIEFPGDAGHLNVRDFGAKGDGVTDDTDAFKRALTASGPDVGRKVSRDKIVYVPDGTYLIRSPIEKHYEDGRYASGMVLIGHSRSKTILKLQDRAEGYDDASAPRAVLFTSSKLLNSNPRDGGRDYHGKGEGNDAYLNNIENLTIDVGEGNPGAIGIDYLANNLGAIRHVLIRAPVGSGATGIAMIRKWPGPLLVRDVRIEGFDVGIDVAQTEYGVTLDTIQLHGQRVVGLRNRRNMVTAHDLTVSGARVAIANETSDGLIVLSHAALSGPRGEAIVNHGGMNLRQVRISGYQAAAVLDGSYIGKAKIARSSQSWSLPIKVANDAPLAPIDRWASVASYGAVRDNGSDATEAIRKAFESGRDTVYFPHGTYLISDNIVVPSSVRRIVGMNSVIGAFDRRRPSFDREKGMFRAANERSTLTIEHIAFDHSDRGRQVAVEATGSHPLNLRDTLSAGALMLTRPADGGEVFLEDTCCGNVVVQGPKGVWGRQLNIEGGGVRIRNTGTPMWILGLKTERNAVIVENDAGARTEILGALIYMVEQPVSQMPMYINRDSKIALSYVEEVLVAGHSYRVHLRNVQRGAQSETLGITLLSRNLGRLVPLLLGE